MTTIGSGGDAGGVGGAAAGISTAGGVGSAGDGISAAGSFAGGGGGADGTHAASNAAAPTATTSALGRSLVGIVIGLCRLKGHRPGDEIATRPRRGTLS